MSYVSFEQLYRTENGNVGIGLRHQFCLSNRNMNVAGGNGCFEKSTEKRIEFKWIDSLETLTL